jgi:hypothetical protein
MPPFFVSQPRGERSKQEPVQDGDVERHEHGRKNHIAEEVPALADANKANEASCRDGGGHPVGTPPSGKHGECKAEREGGRRSPLTKEQFFSQPPVRSRAGLKEAGPPNSVICIGRGRPQ